MIFLSNGMGLASRGNKPQFWTHESGADGPILGTPASPVTALINACFWPDPIRPSAHLFQMSLFQLC